MFIENTEWGNIKAVGKWLKINIADSSFNLKITVQSYLPAFRVSSYYGESICLKQNATAYEVANILTLK